MKIDWLLTTQSNTFSGVGTRDSAVGLIIGLMSLLTMLIRETACACGRIICYSEWLFSRFRNIRQSVIVGIDGFSHTLSEIRELVWGKCVTTFCFLLEEALWYFFIVLIAKCNFSVLFLQGMVSTFLCARGFDRRISFRDFTSYLLPRKRAFYMFAGVGGTYYFVILCAHL